MSQTILYARTSTTDQTIAIQLKAAEAAGHKVDQVICDEGLSGATTKLADRPGGQQLLWTIREGDTLLVRWIDRLSRQMDEASGIIQDFMAKGITVKTIINGMTFDGSTTDPMLKAVRNSLIAFMSAIGEAQYEATRQSQKTGIEHAKLREDAYRGRKPSLTTDQFHHVQQLLMAGNGVSDIAKAANVSRQVVYRTMKQPEKLAAALQRWGI